MSASYTVRVGFVDSTYWDDGSRWTHRFFTFDKQGDAIAFAREVTTKGTVVRGMEGELRIRPRTEDVTIERISRTQVNWIEAREKATGTT